MQLRTTADKREIFVNIVNNILAKFNATNLTPVHSVLNYLGRW